MNDDKITTAMRKYPFQSGIVIGALVALVLFGILSLIFSPEAGLAGGDELSRQDYLRMAVRQYAENGDQDLAVWRFARLGKKGQETLELMKKDSTTDPLALLNYADAVGFADIFVDSDLKNEDGSGGTQSGGVKTSFSKFAKIFLGVLILLVLLTAVLYFWSEKKTADKKRKRVSRSDEAEEKVLRVVKTADLKENDDYFNSENMIRHLAYEDKKPVAINEVENLQFLTDDEKPVAKAVQPAPAPEAVISQEQQEAQEEAASETVSDEPEAPDGMTVETAVYKVDGLEPPLTVSDTLTPPEQPQEAEEESEEDQQLAEMIRNSRKDSSELNLPETTEKETPQADQADEVQPEEPAEPAEPAEESGDEEPEEEGQDDVLVCFQAVYQLGDDLFDETFSLEEGDAYLGECGIGIGETLNNSEPKAVTAFEVWLFDRSDIRTPTHFLLSDFAMTNAEIVERMKQKGECDRIYKGVKTEIMTQSLRMQLTVKELEYGSEMNEHNSYFNQVNFEIKVWKR